MIALLVGVLIGWIWLYPVFMAPNSSFTNDYQSSPWRYGRSASLLILLALTNYKRSLRILLSGNNFLIHFLFLAFPLLSLCVVPDLRFLLYACAPLWLAGLSFLILAGLDERDRKAVALGVSVAAVAFLNVGLYRYGFSQGSFYGRSRTHLGFIHPIYSAGAIIAASYFFFIITRYFFGQKSTLGHFFHLMNCILCASMLIVVDSRNSFVAYSIFLGSYLTIIYAKKHKWLHIVLIAGLIMLFGGFMTYSALAERQGSLYSFLNDVSSLRIDVNSKFFEAFTKNLSVGSLWGETSGLPSGSIVERKTFVSYDSILVTTLSNFGLLFSLIFYLWYLLRGITAYRSKDAASFAAWMAYFFFSIFDAQGLTPSNILIFFLLFQIYLMPFKGEKCLLLTSNQTKS
jgi:hypothetical protein